MNQIFSNIYNIIFVIAILVGFIGLKVSINYWFEYYMLKLDSFYFMSKNNLLYYFDNYSEKYNFSSIINLVINKSLVSFYLNEHEFNFDNYYFNNYNSFNSSFFVLKNSSGVFLYE